MSFNFRRALCVFFKLNEIVEEWGKKKLAYEIQKMHEGFYYFIQFEADAQCPAEVERHVRIMDNVLRYLVVRKDA